MRFGLRTVRTPCEGSVDRANGGTVVLVFGVFVFGIWLAVGSVIGRSAGWPGVRLAAFGVSVGCGWVWAGIGVAWGSVIGSCCGPSGTKGVGVWASPVVLANFSSTEGLIFEKSIEGSFLMISTPSGGVIGLIPLVSISGSATMLVGVGME